MTKEWNFGSLYFDVWVTCPCAKAALNKQPRTAKKEWSTSLGVSLITANNNKLQYATKGNSPIKDVIYRELGDRKLLGKTVLHHSLHYHSDNRISFVWLKALITRNDSHRPLHKHKQYSQAWRNLISSPPHLILATYQARPESKDRLCAMRTSSLYLQYFSHPAYNLDLAPSEFHLFTY
jgi:hypothetical protein